MRCGAGVFRSPCNITKISPKCHHFCLALWTLLAQACGVVVPRANHYTARKQQQKGHYNEGRTNMFWWIVDSFLAGDWKPLFLAVVSLIAMLVGFLVV